MGKAVNLDQFHESKSIFTSFLGFTIHEKQFYSLSIFRRRATRENRMGQTNISVLYV
jgi:hypothetical protein